MKDIEIITIERLKQARVKDNQRFDTNIALNRENLMKKSLCWFTIIVSTTNTIHSEIYKFVVWFMCGDSDIKLDGIILVVHVVGKESNFSKWVRRQPNSNRCPDS